ncbi:hypothetical protein V6x_20490 [Gimesia chilikensis]|uniref:Carboxypeptidase regulatory-like domain-containing protein n=1 Tax=Gimesia chilikensis TaxID=2605989 RepID=A0A517WAR3_9PLAN|nr:hypothetical protein [Gimesia chilikensis]QDU02347.1 hypothetical protein V6x_20490 [Gimesia chilikensis]
MENNRLLIGFALVLLLIVGWVYFPWGEPALGAPKYSVNGMVTVNGEPAGGVTVRFYHKDKSLMPQDQMPVAMTNELGSFELSSFGGADGAAAGEYAVTFYWPVNMMMPNKDRFQGRFNNPKSSKFTVSIPEKATTLSPMEIEIPSEQLLPSEFSLQDMQAAAKAGKQGI